MLLAIPSQPHSVPRLCDRGRRFTRAPHKVKQMEGWVVEQCQVHCHILASLQSHEGIVTLHFLIWQIKVNGDSLWLFCASIWTLSMTIGTASCGCRQFHDIFVLFRLSSGAFTIVDVCFYDFSPRTKHCIPDFMSFWKSFAASIGLSFCLKNDSLASSQKQQKRSFVSSFGRPAYWCHFGPIVSF